MNQITCLLLCLVVLAACNTSDLASERQVNINQRLKTEKTKQLFIPVEKYGPEGFYTGWFIPLTYNATKEYFSNKITVCIDSLNDVNIYGHSVVAGILRPFEGTYKIEDSLYTVYAVEPGDNKYDGTFEFAIDKKNKALRGTWTAKDSSLPVTERKYELEKRAYMYDAKLALTEDIMSEMLYGTYNEKNNKGEAITEDVLKKNASSTLLTARDVENMHKGDLEVLRNSIYARHGYSFKNLRMRTLFDTWVEWYMPVSTDVTGSLTEIEKKNIALIKRYEKHATKYYDEFGR